MVTILGIFLLIFSNSHALFLPSNSSSIFPSSLGPDPAPASNSALKEVLRAIAAKERWDPSGGVRVSELDPASLRVGRSQRYEFRLRVGRTTLMMKLSDGEVSWRKPAKEWSGGFESGVDFEDARAAAVEGVELEGPLELRVDGGDEERISLLLPALNVTHGGLQQIRVGDGIAIKIEGAKEITLSHPHDIGLLSDKSSSKVNQESFQFRYLGRPSCSPLLSVTVVGSAAVVACRKRNSGAYIATVFHSGSTAELLPEKCRNNGNLNKIPALQFGSLGLKMVKSLRRILGNYLFRGRHARLLKAKILAENLVKFRIEVERDITEDDMEWKEVEAWRTRPVVERMWFEIVARVEAGKGWRRMLVRKLTRPIMAVESSPWSNLMSNISFTQLSSLILPPEALTLDVNW